MKKIFLIIILLVLVTGCKSKETSVNIKMDCNDQISTHSVKKGDVLGCELLGDKYEFEITSATEGKVKIKVSSYGLSDDGSLIDKKDSFELIKDKKLELGTQSTDYQEKVIFSYES